MNEAKQELQWLRRWARPLCVALVLLGAIGQLQAYQLYPWKWDDTDIPVPYYINTQNIPANVSEANYIAAVQLAFDAWQQVYTSYISFTYEGSGAAYVPYGGATTDGHNTIGFADMGAGAVGLATLWSNGNTMVEVDIRLNTYQNWATDGSSGDDDVQNVSTHEIGHLVGLDHSDVPGATMWPTTSYGDISQRTLEPDDIAGVTALFPVGDLPGDVDGDNWIGGADLTAIITNWGLTGATRQQGDLTGDGTVSGPDYTEVITYWGTGVFPGEPATIPEPATFALLLISSITLFHRRLR